MLILRRAANSRRGPQPGLPQLTGGPVGSPLGRFVLWGKWRAGLVPHREDPARRPQLAQNARSAVDPYPGGAR